MRRTHLPISSPCHEDWDAMDRVARGRFCGQCDKQVFDLSSMTERDAKDVLREHAGSNICVRYCHDTDGTIRFRAERPARLAVLAVALAACTPHEGAATMGEARPVIQTQDDHAMGKIETPRPEPEPEPQPLMGAVEVVPPQPEPDTEPQAQVVETKGDVAVPREVEVMGELAPSDAPCDPTPPVPSAPKTPKTPVPGMQAL